MSTIISGTSGVTFPDSTSMQTGQQACKAWVNFNGTGTVAIRGSYNVSSITDNGTGDYTVNFTTDMPDTNYTTTGTIQYLLSITAYTTLLNFVSISTSNFRIRTHWASTLYDHEYLTFAVFSN
jgi:hypothetical protein